MIVWCFASRLLLALRCDSRLLLRALTSIGIVDSTLLIHIALATLFEGGARDPEPGEAEGRWTLAPGAAVPGNAPG